MLTYWQLNTAPAAGYLSEGQPSVKHTQAHKHTHKSKHTLQYLGHMKVYERLYNSSMIMTIKYENMFKKMQFNIFFEI